MSSSLILDRLSRWVAEYLHRTASRWTMVLTQLRMSCLLNILMTLRLLISSCTKRWTALSTPRVSTRLKVLNGRICRAIRAPVVPRLTRRVRANLRSPLCRLRSDTSGTLVRRVMVVPVYCRLRVWCFRRIIGALNLLSLF